MRLFYHLSLPYLSNTFLLGDEAGGDAIIIDPGAMDVQLLRLVEDRKFYIRSILVTNSEKAHTEGIRTILKIYDAEIYSGARQINETPCKTVAGGDFLNLHGFPVAVFGAQGFSRDSVIYKIRNSLFTGAVLTAGMMGPVPNAFSKALLVTKLQEQFEHLNDNILVFPGYGPPTTLGIERLSPLRFKP